MSSKDEDGLLKMFSGKAHKGYVDYFNDQLELIMFSKEMSKPEAFEYLNKIIANALSNEKTIRSEEEKYGIDLQMSDDDTYKPSPPRW